MRRLNGWQRLWTVLSGMLMVIAFVLGYATRPTEFAIHFRWADALVDSHHRLSRSQLSRLAFRDSAFANATDSEIIAFSTDVQERMGSERETVMSTNQRYQAELSALGSNQALHIARGIGAALVISILFYLLGWSIAWVRRGFRGEKADGAV